MPIPESTWLAYEQTTFTAMVDGDELRIRLGEPNAALERALERRGVTSWAYLTAWNPASKVLTPAQNEARQSKLRSELHAAGFAFAEGQGVPADSSWDPEGSLLVFGMGVTAAQRLGRRHGQYAIVSGRAGRSAQLIACRDAAITLTVTHPTKPPGLGLILISGFRFLWAFYVNGYRPDKHCQPGLRGRRVDEFSTGRALSGGAPLVLDRMDRYPYVYICGVASGPKQERGAKNLHMPLCFKPGGVVEMTTYNGYVFRAENAELLDTPELPEGWGGITNREHLRCKNFRFAVERFGGSHLPVEA